MDDAARSWALLGIREDFGHQVVMDLRFDLMGAGDIDLVGVGFQIGDLLRGGIHHAENFLLIGPDEHPDIE